MLLNLFPNSAPLFSLSAFFMEFSLYTSNGTSILLELDPSCSTKHSKDSATSANVLWSPLSLYARAIASIIHAGGCGITSANETLFCSSFARAALFVFLNDPSAVDTPRKGALVDDVELLSFEGFGSLLLI